MRHTLYSFMKPLLQVCRECVFSEAFGNEQGSKNRLLNILMNLRKCVDHPYLFDGEMAAVVI